jgi:uncharacterized protein Veg
MPYTPAAVVTWPRKQAIEGVALNLKENKGRKKNATHEQKLTNERPVKSG